MREEIGEAIIKVVANMRRDTHFAVVVFHLFTRFAHLLPTFQSTLLEFLPSFVQIGAGTHLYEDILGQVVFVEVVSTLTHAVLRVVPEVEVEEEGGRGGGGVNQAFVSTGERRSCLDSAISSCDDVKDEGEKCELMLMLSHYLPHSVISKQSFAALIRSGDRVEKREEVLHHVLSTLRTCDDSTKVATLYYLFENFSLLPSFAQAQTISELASSISMAGGDDGDVFSHQVGHLTFYHVRILYPDQACSMLDDIVAEQGGVGEYSEERVSYFDIAVMSCMEVDSEEKRRDAMKVLSAAMPVSVISHASASTLSHFDVNVRRQVGGGKV
uniref:Uncharacterized protein n=1 Tax=Palpitomonas bilix TaxID=652834 RepID=A0A7S3LT26_9EUKA